MGIEERALETGYEVVETLLLGKGEPAANEDFLVSSGPFLAVVDGATDKTGHRVHGMTGGRLVAGVVARALEWAVPSGADLPETVSLLTAAVADALDDAGWPRALQSPCASFVAYSAARREVWRVGDCHFRVGGETRMGTKLVDEENGAIRRAHVLARLASGATVAEIMAADAGRSLIRERLERQHEHANNAHSRLGFAVVNGMPVPMELVEAPRYVPRGAEVTLSSDGFDALMPTLAETVARQDEIYAADPLRIGGAGAPASTKGLPSLAPGTRHDDRAWIRFLAA